MTFKVMITGKNRKIIASDISKHIERETDCETFDCQPLKSELFNTVLAERPDTILILLKDENPSEVRVYDTLRDYARVNNVAIIVIANEEDKKTFMFNTGLEQLLFLPRQFSLSVLCDKLREIKKEFTGKDTGPGFEEFINPGQQQEFPRKHILVVDDDPQQLMQIKEHLREFYEVTAVNSGKLVPRALAKYKVDLIFLDYMMPKMTGPDVLKMLREDPEHSAIPVVFLTGVSEKDTVIRTIKEFMPQGYLLKPTTKSEIVAKVIDILG